jgi:hypothetical protein
MAEEDLGLGAYLLGGHVIKTTQQLAKGPLVAEDRIDTKTAHPAAGAFVRERRLAPHLTLGSCQLLLGNAMSGNFGQR